jgi:hypothetical protein
MHCRDENLRSWRQMYQSKNQSINQSVANSSIHAITNILRNQCMQEMGWVGDLQQRALARLYGHVTDLT